MARKKEDTAVQPRMGKRERARPEGEWKQAVLGRWSF